MLASVMQVLHEELAVQEHAWSLQRREAEQLDARNSELRREVMLLREQLLVQQPGLEAIDDYQPIAQATSPAVADRTFSELAHARTERALLEEELRECVFAAIHVPRHLNLFAALSLPTDIRTKEWRCRVALRHK